MIMKVIIVIFYVKIFINKYRKYQCKKKILNKRNKFSF